MMLPICHFKTDGISLVICYKVAAQFFAASEVLNIMRSKYSLAIKRLSQNFYPSDNLYVPRHLYNIYLYKNKPL